MAKATKALSGLLGGRRGNAARHEELTARAVRGCAEYLAGLPDERLAAAVGALLTAGPGETFDALLATGNRALEAGGERELRLALALADTAIALRARSQGAWRLRGLTAEALGRNGDAVAAYEQHLALRRDAAGGDVIERRLTALREIRACLNGAGLAGAFARPAAEAGADFAAHVEAAVTKSGAGDPEVRRLVALYAAYRRLTAEGRMPDPLLGAGEPIDVSGFRSLIAGRTVCVVAPGAEPSAGLHAYDLVVRYEGGEPDGRADVHAVSVRGATPWEGPAWRRPAGVRLVFGESADAWRKALRRRLVPGAQRHFGDATLRRPVRDPSLVGDGGEADGGSTAFAVIRLLDFLDASPRIDLFGLGRPGELRPREREWVVAHAKDVNGGTGTRIALR
ncbi:hypothetical protein [Streptomyces sp. NBC_01803]|uniref:hypothetical protein n=1 Tax=Streptomyces sp. NBC_01803 TaxID=2975946 RepID=UPI002DDC4B87|nr:hypothetical protein [Streptomyces sp. NBC_01803]WSA43118.1 hypothetical protein OIE51_02260 [Streptomyces sp. NBC_01803]